MKKKFIEVIGIDADGLHRSSLFFIENIQSVVEVLDDDNEAIDDCSSLVVIGGEYLITATIRCVQTVGEIEAKIKGAYCGKG